MSKLAIAHADLSDAATLYPGSELATLPASNLQTRALSEKWRTDGAGAMYAEMDLGGAESIQLVALLATNALSTTQYRVRAATTQANLTAAPGYDSGLLTHWPQAGLGDWDETHLLHWLSAAESYQWWRIDITDGALSYYEAGRLVVAAPFQPAVNFDWGSSHAWANPSTVSRTAGGNVWIDDRPAYRRVDITLGWLTEAEAYAQLAPILRLRSGRKDVLILLDPAATYLQELAFYAIIAPGSEIVRRRQGYGLRLLAEELQ